MVHSSLFRLKVQFCNAISRCDYIHSLTASLTLTWGQLVHHSSSLRIVDYAAPNLAISGSCVAIPLTCAIFASSSWAWDDWVVIFTSAVFACLQKGFVGWPHSNIFLTKGLCRMTSAAFVEYLWSIGGTKIKSKLAFFDKITQRLIQVFSKLPCPARSANALFCSVHQIAQPLLPSEPDTSWGGRHDGYLNGLG